EEPTRGICCVLGSEEWTIARKHAIKPSFTNLDLLRAPNSDRVSTLAWRVLTHSEPAKEGKKRDTFPLMQSSWICSGGKLILLDRRAVRGLVLGGGPDERGPWCAHVTTSYKKHGSMRAPVNRNGAYRWLFELDVVDCTDRPKVREWWQRLETARRSGI